MRKSEWKRVRQYVRIKYDVLVHIVLLYNTFPRRLIKAGLELNTTGSFFLILWPDNLNGLTLAVLNSRALRTLQDSIPIESGSHTAIINNIMNTRCHGGCSESCALQHARTRTYKHMTLSTDSTHNTASRNEKKKLQYGSCVLFWRYEFTLTRFMYIQLWHPLSLSCAKVLLRPSHGAWFMLSRMTV